MLVLVCMWALLTFLTCVNFAHLYHTVCVQFQDKCLSAHSMLERDVWMLERDTKITREEMVQYSQNKPAAPQQMPPPPPPQQQQQQQQPVGEASMSWTYQFS